MLKDANEGWPQRIENIMIYKMIKIIMIINNQYGNIDFVDVFGS